MVVYILPKKVLCQNYMNVRKASTTLQWIKELFLYANVDK